MALEHALLVSLSERPAAGMDLARRFERSIGFFWSATHQQIYRTLARMEKDGWVISALVESADGPARKVYEVAPAGRTALSAWLATPSPPAPLRSEVAVRMRGASYADDPAAVLDAVRVELADHASRLDHYRQLARRQFPDPDSLSGAQLDQYLVLRGGIRLEEFWVDWLTEYLDAHMRGLDRAHRTEMA
jgi:DNA-binding PadR family transcriptional regulator